MAMSKKDFIALADMLLEWVIVHLVAICGVILGALLALEKFRW